MTTSEKPVEPPDDVTDDIVEGVRPASEIDQSPLPYEPPENQ